MLKIDPEAPITYPKCYLQLPNFHDLKYHFTNKCPNRSPAVNGKGSIKKLFLILFHDGMEPTCKCGCGQVTRFYRSTGYLDYIYGHRRPHQEGNSATDIFVCPLCEGGKVWNDGLTAETSEKVREISEKISEIQKEQYASGERVPWQLGLTKETSPGLKITSIKNRLPYDEVLQRLESAPIKYNLLTTREEYYNFRGKSKPKFQCPKCLTISEILLGYVVNGRVCPVCHPNTSYHEQIIQDYLIDLGVVFLSSYKKLIKREIAPNKFHAQEVDIFIPDKALAIEINGLTYHADDKVPNDYHSEKTRLCAEKGVQLVHIFSDEMRNKHQQVKAFIHQLVDAGNTVISADQCEIREVNAEARKDFLEQNHLEGDVETDKCLGLFQDNNLVFVVAYTETDESIEIKRFCSKNFVKVEGAKKRLIQVLKKDKTLTYNCDTRLETEKKYLNLGFEK